MSILARFVTTIVASVAALAFAVGSAKSQPEPTTVPLPTPTTAGGIPVAPSERISIWASFDNAEKQVRLSALLYRPPGAGPFPLVIISHGIPRDSATIATARSTFLTPSSWFVAQGWAVVVPLRRGFGTSGGEFAESDGRCDNRDYERGGEETARDILAVLDYMRSRSFINASRVVLLGHSGGGWGSLAALGHAPSEVVGAIAFAPGRGSDAPDHVCQPDRLVKAARTYGKIARVPTLWLYSENDRFFDPALARSMFDAFSADHSGRDTFVLLPRFGEDGHQLVLNGSSLHLWEPAVAAFLSRLR